MRLFHRHYGKGKPIIILHGLFGLSDNWVTYAKKIASLGFEVLIPDQRNHGRTQHSNVFNYLALSDDLMEFIEEHNIDDPKILGHSMGGKVAMRFALENPELVSKLIVVDISMRRYVNRESHKQIIRAMRAVDFSKTNKISDVEDQLMQNIAEKRIRLFIMKNLYYPDRGKKLGWRINFNAICDNIDEMFDGIESHETFENPALFIRGGKSDYVVEKDITQIRHQFINSEIHTIKEASHWVHAEKPEEFFKLTSKFLLK